MIMRLLRRWERDSDPVVQTCREIMRHLPPDDSYPPLNPARRTLRRLWPLLDWRRAAVLESRRRGAAAMLDEALREGDEVRNVDMHLGINEVRRVICVSERPGCTIPQAPATRERSVEILRQTNELMMGMPFPATVETVDLTWPVPLADGGEPGDL